MCGIFGSSDKEMFVALKKLNEYRGGATSSITNTTTHRFDGIFSEDNVSSVWEEAVTHIGHIQAPTGGGQTDPTHSHPSVNQSTLLWHNGILTERYINKAAHSDLEKDWDTALLHRVLIGGFDRLVEIDGTFSCVYRDAASSLYLFRNAASPMFIGAGGSFSSVKFEGSFSTTPNTIYLLTSEGFVPTGTFINNSNPYFFG